MQTWKYTLDTPSTSRILAHIMPQIKWSNHRVKFLPREHSILSRTRASPSEYFIPRGNFLWNTPRFRSVTDKYPTSGENQNH